MSDHLPIYNKGIEVMDAFAPFYRDTAVAKIEEAGAREGWFALLQAAAVDPQPLTLERIVAVSPYTAFQRIDELLNKALDGGFLQRNKDAGYRLTAEGRQVLTAFFHTAQHEIGRAPALPSDEMERLAALLQRLVVASNSLPFPPEKPNLENSRWTDPGESVAAAVRVDQYLTDLRLFRDDAHTAAWQAYGIDGRAWEALTLLWRGDAQTATELAELLPYRGFSDMEYEESLTLLAQKGWVSAGERGWQMTAAGSGIRRQAEDETNRLFFAAWDVLGDTELEEMDRLLQQLLAALQETVPAAEPL